MGTPEDSYEILQLRKSNEELTHAIENLVKEIQAWNPVHDVIEMVETVIEVGQGKHRKDDF